MCKSKVNGRKIKMTVFAVPKKTSYIIKKTEASKIMNSKNNRRDIAIIKARAHKFEINNLKGNVKF